MEVDAAPEPDLILRIAHKAKAPVPVAPGEPISGKPEEEILPTVLTEPGESPLMERLILEQVLANEERRHAAAQRGIASRFAQPPSFNYNLDGGSPELLIEDPLLRRIANKIAEWQENETKMFAVLQRSRRPELPNAVWKQITKGQYVDLAKCRDDNIRQMAEAEGHSEWIGTFELRTEARTKNAIDSYASWALAWSRYAAGLCFIFPEYRDSCILQSYADHICSINANYGRIPGWWPAIYSYDCARCRAVAADFSKALSEDDPLLFSYFLGPAPKPEAVTPHKGGGPIRQNVTTERHVGKR